MVRFLKAVGRQCTGGSPVLPGSRMTLTVGLVLAACSGSGAGDEAAGPAAGGSAALAGGGVGNVLASGGDGEGILGGASPAQGSGGRGAAASGGAPGGRGGSAAASGGGPPFGSGGAVAAGGARATGGGAATGGSVAVGGAAVAVGGGGGEGGRASGGGAPGAVGGSQDGGYGGQPAAGIAAAAGSAGGEAEGGTTGVAGAAGGGALTPDCDPALTAANKATVEQAIERLFVQGDLSAIDDYWADPYLQHNPIAQSGVAPFRSLFAGLITPGQAIYEPVRTLGECELVLIHGDYTSFGGPTFDMFRLEDGHLVEHWDAAAPGPGPNESGHTALDGPTEPTDTDLTQANERLVLDFVREVLIADEPGLAEAYLSESLVEHDPRSEDGRDAYMEYRANNSITVARIHHVIADGSFIFTMTEGARGGRAYGFYDLYRVEGGQIVEHWNAEREVPASTASGLPIF